MMSDKINWIRDNITVLKVCEDHNIPLRMNGTLYWKGICPIMGCRDSSNADNFTVSPHKNIFYCFKCHANGDPVSLIERIKLMTPIDATNYLLDKYGSNQTI